ncbi:unnamed protein product [Prorocentrum cordatum]|uniref:Uncharacterized protein n=1 Tax=Prorocentrum cordatum TaxID=2364126 RepID=A0ABN9T257_9DINO|nr:unnamed protein product [Polarella glacialis]
MAVPVDSVLVTKNTFLDCRSPWLDPVVLPRRPSSDPAASTSSVDASSSSLAELSGASEHTDMASEGGASSAAAGEGAFRRRTRAQRRRQQRRHLKDRCTASNPSQEEEASASSPRGAPPPSCLVRRRRDGGGAEGLPGAQQDHLVSKAGRQSGPAGDGSPKGSGPAVGTASTKVSLCGSPPLGAAFRRCPRLPSPGPGPPDSFGSPPLLLPRLSLNAVSRASHPRRGHVSRIGVFCAARSMHP